MSWDLFVQNIPENVDSVEDIPDDFTPKPVGSRQMIIEKIRSVVPTVDFSDPSWGVIDGPDYSIEIDLGENEEVKSFACHIRGGDLAAFVVADILQNLNLRAFDPGADSGLFSLGPDGADGQKRWRDYRDRVLRQS